MSESGDPSLAALEEFEREIKSRLEQIKSENLMAVSHQGVPSLADDNGVDSLKKTLLLKESEIEALMQEELLQLPHDKELLLDIAGEKARLAAADNERALDFYKDKVLQVEEEKASLDSLISKASQVDNQLTKMLASVSKENIMTGLRKKESNTVFVFRSLRNELQYILSDLFPDMDEESSVESLLESLISKLLSDPQDPYVTIESTTPDTHIAFLLQANLIRRHPADITKIRFNDPRY